MTDINSIKQAEEMELFRRSDRLLRAAAEAVNALLAEADSVTGIARALKTIGEASDVDRVYIFEDHADPKTGVMLTSQRHEWARAGIAAQIANPAMQNLAYLPVFKRWRETLSAGKPILGLIRDFPERERPLLESQDIISILTVPIRIRENLWGFIGFDDCRRERSWTPAETSILTAIATNIGYIMLQRQTEKTLRRFQAAMEGTPEAIGMTDAEGHHIYDNEAFRKLFGYTVETMEKAGGPIITFKDQALGKEVFDPILKGGQWQGEVEMISNAGRHLPLLLRASAIKDEKGMTIAAFGLFTDITKRKEAERALQESEIRYRRLVEATTDYIYTVNVENGQAVNTKHGPNCIAITGYSSEEYHTDPELWFKMIHPDDRQRVLEQTQRVLDGMTIQPIEHRIYHKNGSIRWVRNSPVPHFDSSGKIIAYDGLISDVTERKDAEEQLKEHTRKLEILNRIITAVNRVENIDMLLNELLKSSMEMVSFDGGGIYLANADKSIAELVCHQGLPDGFIKKAGVLELSAANCRMLFIEGKPIFTDDYSAISSESNAKWNMQSVARIPLISKDKIIGALALVNARGHAFDKNEKEMLLSIGRQIGTAIAKMRSETALRESERKYRTITEQSLVGIQIIKDGLMIFVNDGWTIITGYNVQEVTAWGVEEYLKIVHPEDRPLFMEQSRKKQSGLFGDILPIYDCRFLSKTGETKWVSIHSKSLEFADGRAVVGMIIDITDRKLAAAALVAANKQLSTTNEHLVRREQELLKTNHEKEVLLKEIHHRVKNNLQIISSLINLQIHNIADRNAVGLLKECQNRIKTIAMVHEKMYQLGDLAQVDIGSYLESLTGHIGRMYLTDPASVTIKVNAKNIYLPVDQAIPCALLINELVVNSLKHAFPEQLPMSATGGTSRGQAQADKAGEIRVQMVADENGNYVLTVSDNGVGLPAETDCRKTKSLGMQLVNTFVNQLCGAMELAGNPGTTFKITFAKSRKEG